MNLFLILGETSSWYLGFMVYIIFFFAHVSVCHRGVFVWIEIINRCFSHLAPPLRHFLLRASGEHAYILYIYTLTCLV